jgi:DNA repair protein RecO (recombination protein O)
MRISQQPAYVLHHHSYRETSLVLELFSRDHGRLGVLAKGARRMRLRQRFVLEPFHPLLVSWAGRGELPVLTSAELDGDPVFLSGATLYCAFYASELLLRLLHRYDPHDALFASYRSTLRALHQGAPAESVLRIFEKRLLQELGYGLVLEREMPDNTPLDPERTYEYVINRGPIALPDGATASTVHGLSIRGSSLLALARETLNDPVSRRETKTLLRAVLDQHLGSKPLNTRKLFRRIPLGSND